VTKGFLESLGGVNDISGIVWKRGWKDSVANKDTVKDHHPPEVNN